MPRILRTVTWASYGALCMLTDAHAQVCADRAEVVAHLAAEYGERQRAAGPALDGRVVELFASANGKSWTLIVTMPNGIACLMAAGEGWTDLPLKKGEDA